MNAPKPVTMSNGHTTVQPSNVAMCDSHKKSGGYTSIVRYVTSIMMLAMVCLLANTEALYAECAWVLWWEESTSSISYRTAEAHVKDRSWNILGSFTTNTECENQQVLKIDQMLKRWQKDKAEAKSGQHTINHQRGTNIISKSSNFTGEYAGSYSTSMRYLCLPDTIDPRTIKGK